ncbi:MAG: helix-turn-helix transcriptional regulator [Pseudomonadota bacterium]
MKSAGILALLLFQAFAAAFFLGDLLSALLGYRPLSWQLQELVEIAVACGLLAAIGVTGHLLRKSLRRTAQAEDALRVASGALHNVILERFDDWALTPAERDVAMLALKGLAPQEIANIRETSIGTVKAQTNAIYRKSGVANRAQLTSLFIEELMAQPVGLLPPR